MARTLNRMKPFDTVHGDTPDGALTMQVQEGQVRYFGSDDTEVIPGQAAPSSEAKPKPKPKAPVVKESLSPIEETPVPSVEMSADEGQLDLEQQLARNLV